LLLLEPGAGITYLLVVLERFIAPEPTEEVKSAMRSMLPVGLTFPESKIRNSIAAIISTIAHWDWPEQWGGLFEILVSYLRMDNVSIDLYLCSNMGFGEALRLLVLVWMVS